MRKLFLVRHSLTVTDPNTATAEWHLSEEGCVRCALLADRLKSHVPVYIVTSRETKAIETAQIIAEQLGLSLEVAEGLQEHDRTGGPYYSSKDEYEREVARFFDNPDELVMGRETTTETRERFANALKGVLSQHIGGNLIVVTHGLVISLFAAHHAGFQPFDYWRRLGTPAYIRLSIPDLKLLTTVFGVC